MALSSATGSFNVTLAAATNTVVVSGLGFQPKSILFWWNGRTGSTDGIARATMQRGFGVANTTTDRRCVGTRSVDAVAAADAVGGHSDTACIIELDATIVVGAMDLQSMDAGGFTLVIDDAFVTDLRVSYLALGGTSLTNALTGMFTPTGVAPITQAIATVGFQPDLVFFFAGTLGMGSPPDAGASDSMLMLGVMNGSAGEAVWCGGSNHTSATMQTMAYAKRGECIARLGTAATVTQDLAEFSSFDAGGFTINWTQRTSGGRIHYLALKGVSSVVGDLLTEIDTVTPMTETGFGFAPAAVVFVSAGRAESTTDTPTDHDQLSLGAAVSASNRHAIATLDEHGLTDSEVTTASEFDAVFAFISSASSTITALMDVQSFDSDGYTAIMDDEFPSNLFVWYVALGPAAIVGTTLTPAQGPLALTGRGTSLGFKILMPDEL